MSKFKDLLKKVGSMFDFVSVTFIERVGTYVVLNPLKALGASLLAGIVLAKISAAVSAFVLATGLFALLVNSAHKLKRG